MTTLPAIRFRPLLPEKYSDWVSLYAVDVDGVTIGVVGARPVCGSTGPRNTTYSSTAATRWYSGKTQCSVNQRVRRETRRSALRTLLLGEGWDPVDAYAGSAAAQDYPKDELDA